jgi:hypothetical protein
VLEALPPFPPPRAPPPPPPQREAATIADVVTPFEGLYICSYGPHGQEYIHISLVDGHTLSRGPDALPLGSGASTDAVALAAETACWTGPPLRGRVLLGRKVSGDPNVPSGAVTFFAEVEHEERPTADLGLPILAAFQGAQQVNANPLSWEPEWIQIAIILRAHAPDERTAVVVISEDNALRFTRVL